VSEELGWVGFDCGCRLTLTDVEGVRITTLKACSVNCEIVTAALAGATRLGREIEWRDPHGQIEAPPR
jgi:hypothetical protein